MPSAKETTSGNEAQRHRPRRPLPVLLATLFGAGRVPIAPGTLGALLGVPLALGLRASNLHPAVEGGILLAVVAAAVLITGRARPVFNRPDPPEIVLDEFVSIPMTFFLLPAGLAWYWWVLGFGVNRMLDILKPPPIRHLQRLPGGWGIVADDVAAALVANAALQLAVRLLA